jgi:ribonuclease HII
MTVTPDLEVERSLIGRGFSAVIALDEVGRGALAGPVSVGAVVWHEGMATPPEGIRDSKLVPEKSRDPLALAIREWAPFAAVGHTDPHLIDEVGIVQGLGLAGLQAVRRAMQAIGKQFRPVVLLDGSHDWLTKHLPAPLPVVTRVKADRDCLSVAAASLVAKVERDGLMREAASDYPDYGFDSHKGYGSATHMSALRERGLSPIHRASFVHLERAFPAGQ